MARFHTTILREGKNITGIQVPPEIVEGFGAGKKPPVKVTLNGYTYRSTIAVMGGAYMVGLSAESRTAAGVQGGEAWDVEIELDTEPRLVEVPEDLAAALAVKPGAAEAFDALSTSRRKEFVRQVNEARSQETRDRRIAGIVEKLPV